MDTYTLMQRSVESDANDVKTTFSSWDNCMAKSYCKWPVIAIIVIVSLIVLSVVFCLVRCVCCGLECCCGVCACCNACCPSPRGRGRRDRNKGAYQDLPDHPHNNGFQPSPYHGYQPNPAPPAYSGPPHQAFATFDDSSAGKTGGYRGIGGTGGGGAAHEDALPAMPSWEAAQTRRVPDHQQQQQQHGEDMEMGKLEHPRHGAGAEEPMLQDPYDAPVAGGAGAYHDHPPSQSEGYSAYAPSSSQASTRYEPPAPTYHEAQESGTTYRPYNSHTSPPRHPAQGWADV